MNIFHISAECYPAAKAGGLGDVAGSLPKYLNQLGQKAHVVIPYYRTDWLKKAKIKLIFESEAPYHNYSFPFEVYQVTEPELGFNFFALDIPGRLDRPGIYIDPWSGHSYWDEKERFFSFQIAALEWLNHSKQKPDIVHCHDHHTGLIPFMMNHCFRYESLSNIPSLITIHNGEYQGVYPMVSYKDLPAFNLENIGLLRWNEELNSLATAIKCSWKVTTVSEGYMDELMKYCHGLEHLLQHEEQKTVGIINGIDSEVWNPQTDSHIKKTFSTKTRKSGKKANKKDLTNQFNLDPDKPLFSFIGRLVTEKGADLLPDLIRLCKQKELDASFLILGTGDPNLHSIFQSLQSELVGYFDSRLEYNEELAHQIYAGSDFLLMPSRVEPCGLNQFYAMRYGTIPVVRNTGGLADSVTDIEDDGYGFVFDQFSLEDAFKTIERTVEFYHEKPLFDKASLKCMKLDFSWTSSAKKYITMYKNIVQ